MLPIAAPATTAADRIAETLDKMEAASLVGWQQVLLGVGTTVLAVAGGYLISWFAAKWSEAKQKRLVHQLLRDEIEKRWKGPLYSILHTCVEGSPLSRLNKFAHIRLSQDDLPVCKAIHDRFWEFHFIGDEKFISGIMHVTVLMRDLVDISVKVPKLKEDCSGTPEEIEKNKELMDRLHLFKDRVEEKFYELDDQMKKIGKHLVPATSSPKLLKAKN